MPQGSSCKNIIYPAEILNDYIKWSMNNLMNLKILGRKFNDIKKPWNRNMEIFQKQFKNILIISKI